MEPPKEPSDISPAEDAIIAVLRGAAAQMARGGPGARGMQARAADATCTGEKARERKRAGKGDSTTTLGENALITRENIRLVIAPRITVTPGLSLAKTKDVTLS